MDPGWQRQPQVLEVSCNYRLLTKKTKQKTITNSAGFGTETQSQHNFPKVLYFSKNLKNTTDNGGKPPCENSYGFQ
jgi:hypothetical protein